MLRVAHDISNYVLQIQQLMYQCSSLPVQSRILVVRLMETRQTIYLLIVTITITKSKRGFGIEAEVFDKVFGLNFMSRNDYHMVTTAVVDDMLTLCFVKYRNNFTGPYYCFSTIATWSKER